MKQTAYFIAKNETNQENVDRSNQNKLFGKKVQLLQKLQEEKIRCPNTLAAEDKKFLGKFLKRK